MNKLVHGWAPALALCLPLGVPAQSASTPAEVSSAATPALRYRSAFSDYKPWQDIQPGNWRQLNDALVAPSAGQAGAHAGHATPAPSGATPAVPAQAAPHGGHSMHGGKP